MTGSLALTPHQTGEVVNYGIMALAGVAATLMGFGILPAKRNLSFFKILGPLLILIALVLMAAALNKP